MAAVIQQPLTGLSFGATTESRARQVRQDWLVVKGDPPSAPKPTDGPSARAQVPSLPTTRSAHSALTKGHSPSIPRPDIPTEESSDRSKRTFKYPAKTSTADRAVLTKASQPLDSLTRASPAELPVLPSTNRPKAFVERNQEGTMGKSPSYQAPSKPGPPQPPPPKLNEPSSGKGKEKDLGSSEPIYTSDYSRQFEAEPAYCLDQARVPRHGDSHYLSSSRLHKFYIENNIKIHTAPTECSICYGSGDFSLNAIVPAICCGLAWSHRDCRVKKAKEAYLRGKEAECPYCGMVLYHRITNLEQLLLDVVWTDEVGVWPILSARLEADQLYHIFPRDPAKLKANEPLPPREVTEAEVPSFSDKAKRKTIARVGGFYVSGIPKPVGIPQTIDEWLGEWNPSEQVYPPEPTTELLRGYYLLIMDHHEGYLGSRVQFYGPDNIMRAQMLFSEPEEKNLLDPIEIGPNKELYVTVPLERPTASERSIPPFSEQAILLSLQPAARALHFVTPRLSILSTSYACGFFGLACRRALLDFDKVLEIPSGE